MIMGFGEIAEKLRRSTVQIQTSNGTGSGSGVIWHSSGIILTNAHVVGNSRRSRVELWDKRNFDASIRAIDRARDLAALEIVGSQLPAVEIGRAESLRPGELVIAVGNPFGFTGAVSTGVVHAVGPLNAASAQCWIQASLRLAPGNSGGPLADSRGCVVGINTMVSGPLGLAIPSSVAERFLTRRSPAPELGVTVRPVQLQNSLGLLVLEVNPGGAAEGGSILPGDILLGTDKALFRSLDDLREALESTSNGLLKLRFRRGSYHNEREVIVQLAAVTSRAA